MKRDKKRYEDDEAGLGDAEKGNERGQDTEKETHSELSACAECADSGQATSLSEEGVSDERTDGKEEEQASEQGNSPDPSKSPHS